jgi:hypothetical protein
MKAPLLENMDALGAAGAEPDDLALLAAAALGERDVELLGARADAIEFPMFNMTTGGLWRVGGTARTSCAGASNTVGVARFSMVVKVIQSPLLWQGIGQVPPPFRAALAANYLWRTEAQVYASALGSVMPQGGRLPEVFKIAELDNQRTAIWMEDVAEVAAAGWTDRCFVDAARFLGRLSGSSEARECVAAIPDASTPGALRFFVEGVGANVFIPAIQGDSLWRHPAVAPAADAALVAGLRDLADRAFALVDEMTALPQLPAHGDASPQNLLVESLPAGTAAASFAVIDWGRFGLACCGFDLGQLLSGWVNQGVMGGAELYRLGPLCLEAYCAGLADAGADVEEASVRRGHAASMAVFTGLSAIPTQKLAEQDSGALRALVAARADMARFVLDLLAATD